MKIVKIIGYKKYFSVNEMPTIESLLSGIPSSAIIDRMAFFSARLIGQPLNPKSQQDWFMEFLSNYSEDVQELYKKNFFKLEDQNIQILIFTVLGCLMLTEFALRNFVKGDYDKLTNEQELNVINCFLVINELIDAKQTEKIHANINIENINMDSYLKLVLILQFPQAEFLYSKDLITQSLKCKMFFEWVQTNQEMNSYFEVFLKDNNVESWNQYLFFIWNTYASLSRINGELLKYQVHHRLQFNELMVSELRFIKDLSIRSESLINDTSEMNILDYDFKMLRDKPIFQINKNTFIFYNCNFFVDRIFQGIFFEFCRIAKKSNANFKFEDFRSKVYSTEFSEKKLFHSTIDYFLNFPNSIKIKDNKNSGLTFPDFYFRLKNKIILFEFKDYLVADSLKNSYDYDKIRDYLEKSFFQEGKKSKGATQLRNQIEILNSGGYEFDKLNPNLKKIQIYPIIVFTDATFNCNCVNYIVNRAFRNQLKTIDLKFEVKDLIMIEFDFFVSHQDYFHDFRLKIFDCLESYLEHVSINSNKKRPENISVENATSDFRSFFRDYFKKRFTSYETPNSFKQLSSSLLSNK